jgi:crotonobetainyl-CoA:carnitine CoA-transferase CaiB-like acyl-CoA transferase
MARVKQEDRTVEPPLKGIRVLDLTRAAAGPFCTMILGDFGADVAKVEPTPRGDLLRAFGPFHEGEGTYFLSINRNKRSLAVDFRTPKGRALLQKLARQADVLVENFKPGIADEMGLGYDVLRRDNPKLVYASISGFGASGPYGGWPGVDQIAQGMSGLMSITGTEESGPLRVGTPIGDLTAGMWSALGILAAVIQQRASGLGQRVDTSLIGALIGLLCVQGQRYLSLGEVAGPVGNDHPVICPYGLVETKDGPLNISVATQDMWRKLCRLLDLDGVVDHPDFCDNTARSSNRVALKRRLNEAFGRDTQMAWTKKLIDAGIPAGPVYSLDQVFNDPHVASQGFVQPAHHALLGKLPLLSNPARMECTNQETARLPPPLLGQNSVEVLADFGFSRPEIDTLLQEAVVHQH